jgi:hypothetical protein
MGEWDSDSGYSWQSMSIVNVGDPTRASWGNDVRENEKYSRETKSSIVRQDNSDDAYYATKSATLEMENDTGITIMACGGISHGVRKVLVDTSKIIYLNNVLADMRQRIIYAVGYVQGDGDTETKAECKVLMPGGAADFNIDSRRNALSTHSCYTGTGKSSASYGDDYQIEILPAGETGEGLMIYAASSSYTASGNNSGSPGDLIIQNDRTYATGEWIFYHLMLTIGPRWETIA